MSEIRKWLKIMESVPPVIRSEPEQLPDAEYQRDATVVIGANRGGGVGRFMEFTEDGNAMVDIKGIAKKFSLSDISTPDRDIANGNDWFHMSVTNDTPGTQNDKPEFRPGDLVKVADVYGAVIGPGFGVFVGYGTTGEDCIVLFDGKQIVVPVENVASVLEQDAKDNFNDMDNDGNLSPMSLGSDNIKVEQPNNDNGVRGHNMDHRDEFSKWISAVEEALTDNEIGNENNMDSNTNNCGCGKWDCETCFPPQDGISDSVEVAGGTDMNQSNNDSRYTSAKNDIDFDMLGLEEVSDDSFDDGDIEPESNAAPIEKSRSGKGIKLGDIVHTTEYRKTGGQNSPMTYGDDNLDEEPVDFTDIPDQSNNPAYGQAGRHLAQNFGEGEFDGDFEQPDYDADPMARREYLDDMEPIDPEEAMNMIGAIIYMQDMGLSKAPTSATEDQMAQMSAPKLRKLHSMVMGNSVAESVQPVKVKSRTAGPVAKDVTVAPRKLRESNRIIKLKPTLFESVKWAAEVAEVLKESEIEEAFGKPNAKDRAARQQAGYQNRADAATLAGEPAPKAPVEKSALARRIGKMKGGQLLIRHLHKIHKLDNEAALEPVKFKESLLWGQFKSNPDDFIIVSGQNGVAGIKPSKASIDAYIAKKTAKGETPNLAGAGGAIKYQIIAFTSDGEQVNPSLLKPVPGADDKEKEQDPDPTVIGSRMGKTIGQDLQNSNNTFSLLNDQIGPITTMWLAGWSGYRGADDGTAHSTGAVDRAKIKGRADLKDPGTMSDDDALSRISKRVNPVMTTLVTQAKSKLSKQATQLANNGDTKGAEEMFAAAKAADSTLSSNSSVNELIRKAVVSASGSQAGTPEYNEYVNSIASGNSTALSPILDALRSYIANLA